MTRFGRLAALLPVVIGCAGALQAVKRSPGKLENGEFKPERPPTEKYGPDKTLACPEAGANGALTQEIDQRGPKGQKPQPDGRLCAMADTLLGWKEKELPPEGVRSFLSRHFGLPGTVQRMLMSDLESEDVRVIAQAVVDPVIGFAASAQQPLYGMMTERLKKNLTHVVVVFYDQTIDIQPLPKRLAPNTAATLEGSVTGVLSKPKVEVVDPIGAMQKSPESTGMAFKVDLKCGDHAGKMLIQVVADKEGTDTLVTNFPVWCNTAPPVAAKVPEAAKGPVDTGQAEKQLLDLVNSDRKEAGIKELKPLPALSDIARNIAQKRSEGKGITSADLNQALKSAEIAAPMLLESMAQGFSIDDVYTRFSDSPSDRSNTMNPDVTDVGVGVVKGPVIADKPTYIAAELFIKQRPPVDAEAVKAKLYQAIEKKRADARVEPATKDKTLDQIAQAYAEAAAANGGKPSKEKETEIMAPLYKESMTVSQLGGFVPDGTIALDVAEQPTVVGNSKLVGVGVAVGTSPQFGKGAPFVMVLMGTRHQGAKAAVRGKKAGTTKKAPPPPPPPKRH
ncbi:MAG: hypothetical protein E6J88_06330 [Deltaproteobacteria bacterium]|nr:MAG: hypothetical protein E6J88_06330 [Deltaproteobacteria bacterium]